MKNQFRRKLKTMLLLGTILPIVFFVAIFVYKYYTMNLEAFNNQFNKEQEVFARSVETNWEAFDTLFRAKINLIDKQVDNQVIDKTSFYHELLAEEGILNYYHIHHFVEVFATDSNHKDPIHALVRSKPVNQVWLEVSESGNWLLGYTSLGKKDSLVLEVTGQWLFGEHHHFVKDHLYYHIRFEDMDVYKTYKQVTIPASGEGLHNSKGQWYFYKTLGIEDTPLTYTFVKDISREINYVVDSLVWSLLIILVYLLVTSFITRKTSKELLKPLNYLIERVTLVADGENKYYELDNIDLEFKEILDKFEEMLETSYDNMEAIREQSEVIQEKNTIMIDMNETLEQSTEQIEQSTRQWLIYEKQSKILVDNIKDLMWVLDNKGRIIYINPVVEEKLGYQVEDLLGIPLETLLKESSDNEEFVLSMYGEDLYDVDTVFVNKQGEDEEIYVSSTKRVYHNGILHKIQGVSRDITEERFIQKQLVQKNEISNTLNEISEILTKPEKLEVLLHQIVTRIERLLDPYVCTIRLIDDMGRLELKAGIGAFYALVQEKYLDIDKDISGRAIKESKIIIISQTDAVTYDNYDEVSEIIEKSEEVICLPLEFNDHIIGVMSIGLRESISDSQLKILKVFTNQASAAIEKARIYEELEQNYLNIIKALASTVEAKDAYTEDHSIRVSQYSRMLAETLGLSDEEVSYIDIAGLLHDIGKIGVSDLTLTKEGRLSEEEFIEIKKHPLNGGRIVSEMKLHDYIVDGVLLHHKRFDLKGYPDIHVESLPISARIIGVADAFDAMTSNRSYQKAKSFEVAYDELKRCSGTQFCPVVVDAMGEVLKRLDRMEI